MPKKIESAPSATPESSEKTELRFPDDPNQWNEEQLEADPSLRFHVNPDDFPIFSQQGDIERRLNINEILGMHVGSTADTIAVLSGDDEKYPKADEVIYLDKSARPVSWMVGLFWNDFTNEKRPHPSYLAIDRREWFKRTGTDIDGNEYVDGHMATFSDFKKENVTDRDIAAIRALYIPGGIETEDIDEIMNTPTGLEGKNITIIDEVKRSGSTAAIAQYLVSRAIPEAASVNVYTYWDQGFKILDNGEHQMRGAPVWYSHSSAAGRGIGDVNEAFFQQRHEKFQTPKTRAQAFGAIVLGQYIDLGNEANGSNPSRHLAEEMRKMHDEYMAGHILPKAPAMEHEGIQEIWMKRCESLGIKFIPAKDAYNDPRSYISVSAKVTHPDGK